jgi:hypothetical protein
MSAPTKRANSAAARREVERICTKTLVITVSENAEDEEENEVSVVGVNGVIGGVAGVLLMSKCSR